jgi:hypothetical protein
MEGKKSLRAIERMPIVKGHDSLTRRKNVWSVFLVTESELIYEMRSINSIYKCFGMIANDTTFGFM